jgi:hypothetical protein
MKKTFISSLIIFILGLLLIIVSVVKSFGQDCNPGNYFYVGGGLGASDKNALVNLKAGYNTNIVGFEGSMLTYLDNRNPAMLNVQAIKSIYTGVMRLSLIGGYSYQITSFDKPGGTKSLAIVGCEVARVIDYRDMAIYCRAQVTGDNIMLMIGIEGLFRSKN